MKTRVMQNEPDEPATPKASAVGDAKANHVTHFAARMGVWGGRATAHDELNRRRRSRSRQRLDFEAFLFPEAKLDRD